MERDKKPSPSVNVNNNHPNISEPFKATKLWNDAVRAFYNGVPMSRHWRGLRQYENCFTASEAVNWLHNHLKLNPNFGPAVTKDQTIKLLRKFLKTGLIVEARGNKIYPEDFRDNRELYKFGNRSPLRSLRTPRRSVLAPISSNVINQQLSKTFDDGSSPKLSSATLKQTWKYRSVSKEHQKCYRENFKNESKDENFLLHSVLPNPQETDKVWKETFIQRLQEISDQMMVTGKGSKTLIPFSFVDAAYIRKNMRTSAKDSLNPEDSKNKSLFSDLPDWILSAMKCLVSWPNSSESICNIPNYPGVEIDIFRIVRDYFVNLVIPLIPYELYDSLVRLYIGSEFFDIGHRTPSDSSLLMTDANSCFYEDQNNLSLSGSDSVEDLLLNMSINANQQTSTPCLDDCFHLPQVDRFTDYQNLDICQSSSSICQSDFKTPVTSGHSAMFSAPQSLKLNRLQEYTDFKESNLYPNFNDEDLDPHILQTTNVSSNGTESLNRRTLKSLKNRSKGNSRASSLIEETSYVNIKTPPMVFDKLLKTEELDNFLLPPNSCFETAFTSDSPKTRIIPQKSVDTIHFRNSIRPRSIAVSSLPYDTRSCNDLRNLKGEKLVNTSYLSKINKLFASQINLDSSVMNKSQSEGNLLSYFANSGNDISGVPLSPPEHFKEGYPLSKSKKVDKMVSKNSFALRLRDSLKRKRVKDGNQPKKVTSRRILKKEFNNLKASRFNSTETLVSTNESEVSTSSSVFNLRTRLGGYQNPAMTLSFGDSLADNHSCESSVSEFSLCKSISGKTDNSHSKECVSIVDISVRGHPTLIRPSSHSLSCYSELSFYPSKSVTPMNSHMLSDNSSVSLRMNCFAGSKSVTPTGCLSHSLDSSRGNTIYHSAMSALNQTNLSHVSKRHTISIENDDCGLRCVSLPYTPPTLPRRVPVINANFNNSNVAAKDFDLLHDYQNISFCKKALSTSASELSDSWTDRTPFGRAPPYIHGGIWKHYYSSPSKRLIGRRKGLEKFYGKKACLPGLLTKIGKEICVEALQLVLLLLEPQRKRTLSLLLRMMNQVSSNDKLQLDKELTNRALMVKTFARCVLLSEKEVNYDEVLSIRILTFMMDNLQSIFSPPQQLAVLVHRNISNLSASRQSTIENVSNNDEEHKTYCQQVSPQTFEKQKLTGSQQFLSELLDQIVDNPKLSDREKKKKLKEFKMHYPEIYSTRFAPGKENQFVVPEPKKRLKGFKKFASIKSLARTKSFRI